MESDPCSQQSCLMPCKTWMAGGATTWIRFRSFHFYLPVQREAPELADWKRSTHIWTWIDRQLIVDWPFGPHQGFSSSALGAGAHSQLTISSSPRLHWDWLESPVQWDGYLIVSPGWDSPVSASTLGLSRPGQQSVDSQNPKPGSSSLPVEQVEEWGRGNGIRDSWWG